MSDFGMQQLFADSNYLGPTMQAAERWGIEQERKKADLAKLLQETEQSAALHPLKMEAERLGNEGKVAANRKTVTEASLGEATLPSTITKTISDNELAALTNKVKSYESSIGMLDQAVPMLNNVPPAARHAALITAAKQMGLNPNDPQMAPLMQSLAQVPGEQLPAALSQFKTRLIERSNSYKQAMDVAKLQRDSAERIAADNRVSQEKHEQMRIDAGKYNKAGSKSFAEQLGKMKVKERIGTLQAALAQDDAKPEDDRFSPFERAGMEAMLKQDMETYNAELQARSVPGIVPQMSPSGIQMSDKPIPQVGGGAKRGTRENPIVLK